MGIPRFRILDGLPPYGPLVEPFSASGQGLHREGLVVEFSGADGCAWVGNFQRGDSRLDAVVPLPTTTTVIVIAGGQAYVVDPDGRRCVRTFGGLVEHILEFADCLVFSNGLWLEATRGELLLWRSRRISWDGMINLRVDGQRVVGEAFDPTREDWLPFSVDLDSGEVTGGSYPPDLP